MIKNFYNTGLRMAATIKEPSSSTIKTSSAVDPVPSQFGVAIQRSAAPVSDQDNHFEVPLIALSSEKPFLARWLSSFFCLKIGNVTSKEESRKISSGDSLPWAEPFPSPLSFTPEGPGGKEIRTCRCGEDLASRSKDQTDLRNRGGEGDNRERGSVFRSGRDRAVVVRARGFGRDCPRSTTS